MAPIGKVLVINDAPSVTDLLAQWLAQQEYCCVFVNNREEARALLERLCFDAVMYGHEFQFSDGVLAPPPPRRRQAKERQGRGPS